MKTFIMALSLLLLNGSLTAKERIQKKSPSSRIQVDAESEDSTSEDSDQLPPARTRNGKKLVKLKSDEISDDSSEAHRQNQTISLTVEPIGFIPFPARGGAVGYYLTPDNIIEARYAEGEFFFIIAEILNSMTTVQLKTFWGNSFYTNLGVGSRSLGYRFEFDEVDNNGVYTGRGSSLTLRNNVLGVNFGIGNRWQWENFTLGCDWLGIFSPLSTSGSSEVINKNYSDGDLRDARDAMDRFSKQGTVEFLRFYLGVSF